MTAIPLVQSIGFRRTRPFVALMLVLATPMSFAAAQRAATGDSVPCAAALNGSVPRAPATDTAAARMQPSRPSPDSAKPVAVVIYAAASAREVTFAKQPDLHVRLCGGLDSIHVIDRRNLPSPVVVGTTYRDVYVAVQIFGRLNADCITQTLTGRRTAGDSTRKATPPLDCASLELRGTSSTRPPADSGRPPNTSRR